MQSVEVRGMDEIAQALEDLPRVIEEARAEVFEEIGQELLPAVQARIGGSGSVAGAQEYVVGSGKGYVAVRAKRNAQIKGYAAGYVTNALEHGHKVRNSKAHVSGKYMYRETANDEMAKTAETVRKRIEEAALKRLEEK